MQHTDKAIAEFEAWWDRQPFRDQFEDVKDQMRNVWLARGEQIQKAIAEMPVHMLRETFNAAYYENRAIGSDGEQCRAGVLAVIEAAIEAAGVTVRG